MKEKNAKKHFIYRNKVIESIGDDLYHKYQDIEDLLVLIEYRYEVADGNIKSEIERIFDFDSLFGKGLVLFILGMILSPILWVISHLKYFFVPFADPMLVFSNTFVKSRRYPVARTNIEEKYGCTEVITFSDTLKRSKLDVVTALKKTFSLNYGRFRPIFVFGYSICGILLKIRVNQYCELMYQFREGEKNSDQLDKLLSKLKQAYIRRINYLTTVFSNKKISFYCTVNQYNLRDLLIIKTLNQLNIRTIQQEHHAMQFSRTQFDIQNPLPRLSFVSEYSFWSESEKIFHEKVFSYENYSNLRDDIKFIVSGNTELTYEQAIELQKKYPIQRKLTFMSSAVYDNDWTGDGGEYEKWRWDIWNALRQLSDQQNIQVCVRYTPYGEEYFRKKEIPILTKWGFSISQSIPETLMEDMFSSLAVMSSTSSVLATARAIGRETFRVKDISVDYISIDPEIHDVDISGIASLILPSDSTEVINRIDKNMFFDVDRLIEKS